MCDAALAAAAISGSSQVSRTKITPRYAGSKFWRIHAKNPSIPQPLLSDVAELMRSRRAQQVTHEPPIADYVELEPKGLDQSASHFIVRAGGDGGQGECRARGLRRACGL